MTNTEIFHELEKLIQRIEISEALANEREECAKYTYVINGTSLGIDTHNVIKMMHQNHANGLKRIYNATLKTLIPYDVIEDTLDSGTVIESNKS